MTATNVLRTIRNISPGVVVMVIAKTPYGTADGPARFLGFAGGCVTLGFGCKKHCIPVDDLHRLAQPIPKKKGA